ncbi:tRNA (adenosine(37)-N6)-dimethylallyltransferase MiaA [bacterium]|nr:tRNA (adenosine(37)-N6)-dimethylallyltransferase MiaA [bacterium]MCB2201622.1 tRNA (adenosine(37)-N6)-dimethylallyltransferase MiaA [bacterium]
MADPRKLPIICGPTASGKTGAAVALADRYHIEVVSADSRQMIRRLDIGTAKPTPDENARCVFHLVNNIEPGERYTAFRFIDEASDAIEDILSRHHFPIVVGGTGLYLRALAEGVVEIEAEDMAIRERLEKECAEGGANRLYEELRQVDPLEAAKVHPNNHVRLVRALEIYHLTGKPKSELIATGAHRKAAYDFDFYCLAPSREELYDRINTRVDRMLQEGLLDEIERLAAGGLTEPIRRSNVIGYNELLDYLEGKWSLDEAVAMIKQNTRRYAKRQMTWFRAQTAIRVFSDQGALLESLCANFAQALAAVEKT